MPIRKLDALTSAISIHITVLYVERIPPEAKTIPCGQREVARSLGLPNMVKSVADRMIIMSIAR